MCFFFVSKNSNVRGTCRGNTRSHAKFRKASAACAWGKEGGGGRGDEMRTRCSDDKDGSAEKNNCARNGFMAKKKQTHVHHERGYGFRRKKKKVTQRKKKLAMKRFLGIMIASTLQKKKKARTYSWGGIGVSRRTRRHTRGIPQRLTLVRTRASTWRGWVGG